MELATWLEYVAWLLAVVLIYKILDYVIRLPYIGGCSDRYILVTGCDTGFGNELAKRLDARGCHVIAGCLTEEGKMALRAESSSRLVALLLDVAKPESVRSARDEVVKHLPSGKGLWGVVNNAGTTTGYGLIDWHRDLTDYHKTINVNLLGLIDVTTTFLPLVKKEYGRIVNVASMIGRVGMPGGAPYCVSKYGVEGFSDVLRLEIRDFGCSVHILEPGFHKTAIMNNVQPSGTTIWDRLPENTREEYGQDNYERTTAQLGAFVASVISIRISDVVDAMEHALLGVFPRDRYVIGKDARFFFIPISFLPTWLGDKLLNILVARGPPILAAFQATK